MNEYQYENDERNGHESIFDKFEVGSNIHRDVLLFAILFELKYLSSSLFPLIHQRSKQFVVFLDWGVPIQVFGQFLGDKMITNVHLLVHNPKIEIITRTEFGVGHYQVIPFSADHDPDRSATGPKRILFDSIFFYRFKSLREPLAEDLAESR
jgi:hypothetical protein